MKLYFTTIVRGAPVQEAGELVCLDWNTKKIQSRVPIFPENPVIHDPNPRGNTRGGRGIVILPDGDLLVASYHSLYVFSRELAKKLQFSHGLLAGLHEVTLSQRSTVWVASTSIDAALEFEYPSFNLVSQIWPREMPGIQQTLNVEPLSIDKDADNRARFLEERYAKHPHHLHLNIVREWDGHVYALFHSFGVIADLSLDKIIVRDPALKGAHNLSFFDDGIAAVNNTYRRAIQFYDLRAGKLVREINVVAYPEVRHLVSPFQEFMYWARGAWNRIGIKRVSNPLPFFLRGMDTDGKYLFIGTSPAAILQIEISSGKLVDLFSYSHDLAYCIHGLATEKRV